MSKPNTAATADEPENTPDPATAEQQQPLALRQTGINVSGDTVAAATAHLDDEQRALVRWAFAYAKDQGFNWEDAERAFKVSRTTLFRVFTDQYRQPAFTSGKKLANGTREKIENPRKGERLSIANLCESLTSAKRLAEARGAVQRLPFIVTKTYRRIEKFADEVLATNTIGVLLGESQIGKTWAAREYTRTHNHGQTVLVTCPPAAGVQLLVGEIARALHIGHSSFDKTFVRVCGALDENTLLILDEAHMLFETYQKQSVARCLATIRQIHDRTGCGLLIMATNVFAEEAKRSEFKNTMKQIFRRGTLVLNLGTDPAWEDVLQIVAHYGLPEPKGKPEETLRVIAHEDGLGKITKYLHGAARKASKAGERMSWGHFLDYVGITDRMAAGLSLRVREGGAK
jgi:DNA transposition AAA+ family ATPase